LNISILRYNPFMKTRKRTAARPTADRATPVVRFRVDLGTALAIGPGKISLLEKIGQTGSLSEAARALGMSYRRAWQLLASLNEGSRAPVTDARKGGVHGGGSQLTSFGRQMIRIYRAFDAQMQRRARAVFAPLEAQARIGTHAISRRLPLSSR
jgi:molybdate transport system regulatory protein